MVKHARFTIQGDETDCKSLVGDVRVLLLGFEDFFYHGEFLGRGEAANRGLIDAVRGAEAVARGGFLELLDQIFEFAIFGESVSSRGFDGVGLGCCTDRSGEDAMETTLEGRHGCGEGFLDLGVLRSKLEWDYWTSVLCNCWRFLSQKMEYIWGWGRLSPIERGHAQYCWHFYLDGACNLVISSSTFRFIMQIFHKNVLRSSFCLFMIFRWCFFVCLKMCSDVIIKVKTFLGGL